jgi:hypothetical protein
MIGDAPLGELLTDDELAPFLRRSTRTARRKIARWWAAWEAWERAAAENPTAPVPRYPRVVRVQTGGRPGHVVVRESFERWRRGQPLTADVPETPRRRLFAPRARR